MSNQGASGILNENIQGDTSTCSYPIHLPDISEPKPLLINHIANWFDHSRDLLHMINHFREEMPRPIIGVGHSMGCAQL